MSQTNRWARNTQLAKHAGVSVMTVWRWKQLPDFPPAAIVGGTEYNDLDVFDAWMASHIARPQCRTDTRTARCKEPAAQERNSRIH
jgi:predicted DNA-binding transcriptional regulator AlpA